MVGLNGTDDSGSVGADRFAAVPQAARSIWAKSDEHAGHGLLAHMLDVAAVAEQILRREPASTLTWLEKHVGRFDHQRVIRWVAWLVGQHDLGKATIGFQAKWPVGQQQDERAGLTFPTRLRAADRHDLNGVALLLGRLSAPLAGAVAAHHGFHFLPTDLRQARLVGEPPLWAQVRGHLLAAYDQTLLGQERADVAASSVPLEALNWLAGLTSVADWIGSNTDWFALGERDVTLAGHHAKALDLADRALDQIGWPYAAPLQPQRAPGEPDTDLADWLGRMIDGTSQATRLAPRPLQEAADKLLQACAEPALLIVEAPMGEGKTELAFLATLRLQARLGHRGLYIGLPTQATGNAMFERARRFLHALGEGRPLDLQLAHGAAALDERVIELRGIHGSPGDGVRSSEWFSQRRRALLSPYGVGTIDQALYATLNVKHHFVRLWGLANRVVVLDEVHAYDSYTGGLIEALLRWLKRLGCSVILMSATLPAARRQALLEAWTDHRGETPLPELAYPRVLLASGGAVTGLHCPSRPQAPIRVSGIDERIESIAERVIQLIVQGGCLAVIVNTVDRAQQLYRLLRPQLDESVPVLLFHARFPADERAAHERAVLDLYGKEGQRPQQALLIATQVAEQSLDIDFDLLISDLAPVDLLLQRAGRLHRHVRTRPAAHAEPHLIVAGLMPAALPELKRTGWASVYGSYLLGRTWAFVSREERWTLPQDIDRLVQAVYGDGPLLQDVPETARDFIEGEAWGEHIAEQKLMERFALNAAVDARAEPQNAYIGKPHGREAGEGLGADNRTRFGAESISLIPVHRDGGLWRLHPGDSPFDPEQKPDPTLARRLLGRQVKLGRVAVVKALQGSEVPAGWAEHPWLRDLRVLPLVEGCWRHGSLCVRLDAELGIVYNTEPTLKDPPNHSTQHSTQEDVA